MTRLICIFLLATFILAPPTQATDLAKDFGIGVQATTPAFGGISFRYTGLSPIYLQTVGRFILSDGNSDHVLGAGISHAIFEHQSRRNLARLFFTLEGGWRYEEEWEHRTTTLGVGLAFGGELVFSLGGIPLGLNVEIGQGFGREKERDQAKAKGLAGVYVGSGIHAYF